jgi:hypothetical protein
VRASDSPTNDLLEAKPIEVARKPVSVFSELIINDAKFLAFFETPFNVEFRFLFT